MRITLFVLSFLFGIGQLSLSQDSTFSLNDFLSDNPYLAERVEEIFEQLSEEEKVAQLIMPAAGPLGNPESKIDAWVKDKKIGGLLLLNGTKEEFKKWIKKYDKLNEELGSLPFLYSADAEPSLINRKIKNTPPVKNANKLTSAEEVKEVAHLISQELLEIGVNYNFAPVVDMSPNETVGWRGFGQVPDSVIPWSDLFIQETQKHNIIATAKHFPGHGFVEGDSHKKLVYINGEMKEVQNYVPLIENGVTSVLIGHIAIKNNAIYNTNDKPSSISKEIITDLLRDSLNFQGLIVTDAMNMQGVATIANADVLAIDAGIDILLMPLDAGKAHAEILAKYQSDEEFKKKVDTASKRVIRAKLCVYKEVE